MLISTVHGVTILEIIYYAVGILALLGGAGVIRLLMRISGVFTSIIGRKATPWRQEIPSYLEQIQAQGQILADHTTSMGGLTDSVSTLADTVGILAEKVADLHLLTDQLRSEAVGEAARVTDVAAQAAGHLVAVADARADQVLHAATAAAQALPPQ